MKLLPASAAALALAVALPVFANATKDEAVAMVKKGVAFIGANGSDKAYAAITAKDKEFVKDDL
ncbi:MAG TPA: hypothetical protein PLZ50_03815 [Rubrivivax sp.]|jgi:hypothetical protein|nr:hypothetical protein [Rubrivivax sp.]